VFRGGWSLDAVEAVCTENLSLDLLDGLALLVDKSLVQQRESANGSPRFVLLETINEYAQEQLEASGSAETLRNQHAAYYVALAERAEPELRLARYDYWAEIFEIERDNIRAALEWSLSGGSVVDGVRLASALVLFWYGKGYHVEGIRWMQRFLDRLDEVPRHYHPKFLASAGHMAWFQDLDMAKGLLERALAISREMEDTERIAWSLAFLGYSMMEEPEAALPMVEESLTLFRALDFQPGIAQNLNILGEIYRTSGDDARARRAYEESLAISRQTGETRRICYICSNLAYIAQHEGDHKRAIRFSLDHLQLALERKNRLDITTALRVLAGSIGAEGDPQRAARLLGTTEIVLERLGSFHQPGDQHEHGRIVASVRNQLDDDAFNAAWEQGRNTSLEAAIAEVLSEYPD
jgi:tetratricopeptide (TPR) repeat protein